MLQRTIDEKSLPTVHAIRFHVGLFPGVHEPTISNNYTSAHPAWSRFTGSTLRRLRGRLSEIVYSQDPSTELQLWPQKLFLGLLADIRFEDGWGGFWANHIMLAAGLSKANSMVIEN